MKIFVASCGRSGTRFMAEVFRALTDIQSYHERWPKCINVMMEDINNHNGTMKPETERLLDMKVQNIRKNSKGGDYFESSHTFIKSFCPKILSSFDDTYCIYLERPLNDVLMSYAQRGRRSRFPLDFQLLPHWRGNVLRIDAPMGFYGIVAWNWFEVKARYGLLKDQFNDTYEFDFRLLNDPSEWKRLFKKFGIKAKKFTSLPENLYRHSSNISADHIPSIMRHIRENWNAQGSYNFITDAKKLLEGAEQ